MTGILIAAIIIGLIVLVGGFALFTLLPVLMAFLGSVALVAVMAVVSVLMIPNFVTLDDFKPEIIRMLKDATGREIAIGGPIGFTIWPVLGLQLRDISIGNPPGSDTPIMLAAQQIGVGVTLSSLMDHRLELRELRIVGGQFNLATDEKGRANWAFSSGEGASALESDAKPDDGGAEQFSIKDVQIEKIEIVDTNVSYDTKAGNPVDLDDIDVVFSMPSLDKPLSLAGDFTFRDREVKLQGNLGALRAIMAHQATPINLTLDLGGDQAAIKGTMHGTDFKGDITALVANLGNLASWAGSAPAQLPVNSLTFSAKVDANSERAELANLALKLDDIAIGGTASLNWSGARPRLVADVDVSTVNLDRFMAGDSAPAASASPAAEVAPDLGALDKFNAEITARLAGLVAKGAALGSTTAKVSVQGGRLQASMTPASLYDGTVAVKADVSAMGRGGRTFTASTVLSGVNIEPVLTQFAAYDRLSGKGDFTLNVSGPVAAPTVLKREIDGDGRFIFRDGAYKGVNIAAMIRNAKSVLGRQAQTATSGPVQTDFTELSGTFRIADGVVSNSDLKMLSPLIRVTGRGVASLPASTVDYRVEAALVADLTGQGGVLERRGLVIPINIRGPFSNLKYEPDLQGLVLGNIDAAKDVGAAIQNLNTKEGQRGARDAIKGLLGLPTSQPPATTQAAPAPAPAETPAETATPPAEAAAPPAPPAAPKPADVLRGLLTR